MLSVGLSKTAPRGAIKNYCGVPLHRCLGTLVPSATLYLVATPIGNLEDMTPRAVRVLTSVDVIAAEDTRHSAKLLRHFGIQTEMIAVHEHNERDQVPKLIEWLRQGKSIALISDAGTPLISDPGFPLVRAAHDAEIPVVPIPGASALVAALAASGLPCDRFVFEGFLPARSMARRATLERLRGEARTLVFYESTHRILESMQDMVEIFGGERQATVARELTKQFETVRTGHLAELLAWMTRHEQQQLGEFVVVVHGADLSEETEEGSAEAERVLHILLAELPVSQAAELAARVTGISKNTLYRRALALKADKSKS
jgi:16S rRNA (cytidine1402-2'-O)-methyltransferase